MFNLLSFHLAVLLPLWALEDRQLKWIFRNIRRAKRRIRRYRPVRTYRLIGHSRQVQRSNMRLGKRLAKSIGKDFLPWNSDPFANNSVGAAGNGPLTQPTQFEQFKMALVAQAAQSRVESVTVFDGQKRFESLKTQKVEEGVRTSRLLGVNLMDGMTSFFLGLLKEEAEKCGVVGGEKNRAWQARFGNPSMNRSPIEVPSEMEIDNTEHFNAIAAKCSLDKGLAIKTARSASIVNVWFQGYMLPLARIINSTCGDLIDIQQYFFSCMNAAIEAGFCTGKDIDLDVIKYPLNAGKGREGNGLKKFRLLAYNSSLPLGKTPCGKYNVYLADAGSDGTTNFSWTSDKMDDVQGQSRSILLKGTLGDGGLKGDWVQGHDEDDAGGIIKGMHCGDEIRILKGTNQLVKKAMYSSSDWDALEFDERLPMVVDINMPKGKGKLIEAVKKSKESKEEGVGFCMDDYFCWSWFIRVLKEGAEHSQKLATSFQETPFWQGVQDEYLKTNPAKLVDVLKECIQGEQDPHIKILLERLCQQQGLSMEDFNLNGLKGIPYRAIKEDTTSKLLRLASSGTFRKKRVLKERANHRTPLHMVVVCDHGAESSLGDMDSRERRWIEKNGQFDWDALTLEEQLDVRDPVWKWFAHQRTPTLSPLSLTCSWGISHSNFLSFADAIRNEEEDWETANGTWRKVLDDVSVIVSLHNKTLKVKQHGTKDVSETLESMKIRLVELGIALTDAKLDSCFITSPLEGRDRNADHDGDDTACDPSLWWVGLYRQLEAHWDGMPRFVNELPKESKMQWGDARLNQLLPDEKGEMVSSKNVKAMSLVEMLPSVEYCTIDRLNTLFTVSMVETQGPTGLASNVAADMFARIKWESDGCGGIRPTAETHDKFLLWIFFCLLVQICIDWQKRAYALKDIMCWRKLANGLLKQGGEGLTSFVGLDMGGDLDLDSVVTINGKEKRQLGSNWCYSPAIIYAFSQQEGHLKDSPCMWKGKRDGTWWAPKEKIQADLLTMNRDTKFFNVALETHCPKSGWLAKYGGAMRYVNALNGVITKGGVSEGQAALSKYVDNAFRHIQHATLEAGEDGNLGKLGEVYRGNLFLTGMGFSKEAIKELACGKSASNYHSACEDYDYSLVDVLIAVAKGDSGTRPIPGLQIVLSWFSALNKLEEWEEKVVALGKSWALGVAYRMTNLAKNKKGYVLPRLANIGTYRWFGRRTDIPAICSFVEGEILKDVLPRAASSVCDKALELLGHTEDDFFYLSEEEQAPIKSVCKMALMDLTKILRTLNVMKGWNTRQPIVTLKGKAGPSYVSEHFAPVVGKLVDEQWRPLGVEQSKDKANMRSDDFHMPLLGSTDPIYMAYLYVTHGVPFQAPPRVAKGLAFINSYLEETDCLVQSRSLLGGAGWVDKYLYNRYLNLSRNGSMNLYECHNAMQATCGSLLAGSRTWNEDGSERNSKKRFNSHVLSEHEKFVQFESNQVAFLEAHLTCGAVPLPKYIEPFSPKLDGAWHRVSHNKALWICHKVLLGWVLHVVKDPTESFTDKQACWRYLETLKGLYVKQAQKYGLIELEDMESFFYPLSGVTVFQKQTPAKKAQERSRIARAKKRAVDAVLALKTLGH